MFPVLNYVNVDSLSLHLHLFVQCNALAAIVCNICLNFTYGFVYFYMKISVKLRLVVG